MKFLVEVSIFCLISLIWGQVVCDKISETSSVNRWMCTCISAYEGNQSFAIPNNCSSSCNCSRAAGGSSENRWECICDANGFPKVVANGRDTNCFTACTCSYGSSSEAHASKKHPGKVVVVMLLLCILLTTLALIGSGLCYIYGRNKCPIQRPLFSSDKEMSCNSATNLINHRTYKMTKSDVHICSSTHPITGYIQKASLLFKSKKGMINGTLVQFSYSDLENATNKFSDSKLVGAGGSSYVYRGHLKDGKTVAVKRIRTHGGPDAESIFSTEIELLSRLHHCNVVPLLGYCSEYKGKHAERLLVFEYMANGDLRECLNRTSGKYLDWATRVTIALGAARGLEYLHEAAAPRILHRDVKSTNILLDENWRAKITDLGMAKRLKSDGLPSCSNSPARMQGTFGYFAPEYAIIGRASLKSDVFSFGVVLLELITGREPIHKGGDKVEESLVIWAMPRLEDSKRVILELPDPNLEGKFPEEEMQMMCYLARECLLLDPDSRPTMSEVVQLLSAITPEISRRRNFPINLSQRTNGPGAGTEGCDKQTQDPAEGGYLKQGKSNRQSPQCVSPLNIDRTPFVKPNENEIQTASAEYIQKLILLTSNAKSRRSQNDEAVDLTEPRFESFCMGNVQTAV